MRLYGEESFGPVATVMRFHGVKASGWGRFGGQAAIAEFTDRRRIALQTGPQHYPI